MTKVLFDELLSAQQHDSTQLNDKKFMTPDDSNAIFLCLLVLYILT